MANDNPENLGALDPRTNDEKLRDEIAVLLAHAYGDQDFDEAYHRKIAEQILDAK